MKLNHPCLLLTSVLLLSVTATLAETPFQLRSFNSSGAEGGNPRGLLTLSGNTLYGVCYAGGGALNGAVYKINTDGTGFTVLKSFAGGAGGANPFSGLVVSGSTLYGVAYAGGNFSTQFGDPGEGLIYKVNTDGTGYGAVKTFSAVHPAVGIGYTNADGANPQGSMVLSDGVLYGTTTAGGNLAFGNVFRMNPDGTGFTVLKNFGGGPEGYGPNGNLLLAGDTLYGAAFGPYGTGTLFKMTTNGAGFTVLKTFSGGSGSSSVGGLLLVGSTLYGTTYNGGTNGGGTLYKINADGTGYAVVKHFGGTDGSAPYDVATLSGSTLYGTTYGGGSAGAGVLYKVNLDGTGYEVLFNFSGANGASPSGGVTLSGSQLYGTTAAGGTGGQGTVFSYSLATPAISISTLNNQPVVIWPGSATNFVVQSTTNLASGIWVNVTNGIPVLALQITNGTSPIFFRLH